MTTMTEVIDVDTDPMTAFTVFTDEFDQWWGRGPIDAVRHMAARRAPHRGRRRGPTGGGLRRRGARHRHDHDLGARRPTRVDDPQRRHDRGDVRGARRRARASASPAPFPTASTAPPSCRWSAWHRSGSRATSPGGPQARSARTTAGCISPFDRPRRRRQPGGSPTRSSSSRPRDVPDQEATPTTRGSSSASAPASSCSGAAAATIGTDSPFVYVDDLDAHLKHAEAAGATIVRPITEHGFRSYTAADCEGRHWVFAQAAPAWGVDFLFATVAEVGNSQHVDQHVHRALCPHISGKSATSRSVVRLGEAQRVDLGVDVVAQLVDVGDDIGTGDEPEREMTPVAHDGHVDRRPVGDRTHRVGRLDQGAVAVERDIGPGHVGDHHVERQRAPPGQAQAADEAGQSLGRRVAARRR